MTSQIKVCGSIGSWESSLSLLTPTPPKHNTVSYLGMVFICIYLFWETFGSREVTMWEGLGQDPRENSFASRVLTRTCQLTALVFSSPLEENSSGPKNTCGTRFVQRGWKINLVLSSRVVP